MARFEKIRFKVWDKTKGEFVTDPKDLHIVFYPGEELNSRGDYFILSSKEDYMFLRSIGYYDVEGRLIFEYDILGELTNGRWEAIGYISYQDGRFYITHPQDGIIYDFTDLQAMPDDDDKVPFKIMGSFLKEPEILEMVNDQEE